MIRAVDHVVILVNDLDQATADYRALGFNVVPGGEHTGGASHNVLISFADGSYLELIAFRRTAPEHTWWRHMQAGEGLIDVALLPSDIEADLQAARSRGLDLEGPFPGGRLRPDGVRLEWQTGRSLTADLPFFCADVTPRERRVPAGEAHSHPNGAQGLAAITIACQDIATSSARYQALLGSGEGPEFALSSTIIRLSSDAAAQQRIAVRGEGPLAISIRVQGQPSIGWLDQQLAHGARIELIG